ncbi:uncharacterized protein isoform X3 [Leptinotarsa decemlineata]|uniref:uncharacterized protein isoform X3 n=1 Tax=Leptinotarsa decemlineata TaxID=7539 RepID=UPI003D304049
MEEDNKDSIITLEDFPFICRICLRREDLRPFEEEDCLFDLFHAIVKIDVYSRINYPKNVCDKCVSKLEDVSLFIDISKYNDSMLNKSWMPKKEIDYEEKRQNLTQKTTDDCEGDIYNQISQVCRICLSKKCLILFKEKELLAKLFQEITEVDLTKESSVCNKCIANLEGISRFICSSLNNHKTLESVVGAEVPESERPKSCNEIGGIGTMNEDTFEINKCFDDSKMKSEIIDIKEEIIDCELATSTEQTYQNELEVDSHFSSEKKLFENTILKKIWMNKGPL